MKDINQKAPREVTVFEVGPRDGLQNCSEVIPTEVKVQFIDLLADAGVSRIEATSFVRPGMIPQLADAEEVAARIKRPEGVLFTALVPNLRGMERARKFHLGGIAVFTAASETFSRKNTNASIAETLVRFAPVIREAASEKMWIRGYVSTAFGCPYEGSVDVQAVVRVTEALLDLGVDEVSVGDTIGVATPADVDRVVGEAVGRVPSNRLALHFHDTRGTALANVLWGLQMGIATFDASAGGLGGCPFAPGAAGNLATEDLIYMLDGMGIQTGISLQGVVSASRFLSAASGVEAGSRYLQAAPA